MDSSVCEPVKNHLKSSPDEWYEDVNKMKADLGYFHHDVPNGISCRDMYERYMKSYPEVTAIVPYQRQCLDYQRWKLDQIGDSRLKDQFGSAVEDVSIVQKDLKAVAKSQKLLSKASKDKEVMIFPAYQEGWAEDLLRCNDVSKWPKKWQLEKEKFNDAGSRVEGSNPGSKIPLGFLFPGTKKFKKQDHWFKQRPFSLSGKPVQCAPVASVPLRADPKIPRDGT